MELAPELKREFRQHCLAFRPILTMGFSAGFQN